ncbi:MAG TPA: malto-oligosyltrehalose trehalohydrolase [Pseudolabrys sp.]|nr:malto-oligosyltrehalose trehalohydrolase [Pseudolabrys sp.]
MSAPASFGPLVTDSGVRFRLWAPAARSVTLLLDRSHPMQAKPDGWHETLIASARAGTRYRFRIDDEIDVPDPASHFQPEDVNGPSEVIDHGYTWRSEDWKGRPWHDAVISELHVGTFTPEGSLRAAIDKLDQLVATGITAIELMPLADFFGRWNWGYDGVLLYAPDSAYGRPEDLKALIDAAHMRGLMVFLDVVYNHFGPEGNYLGRYAPAFFTKASTPWGSAIDYRVPQVRSFVIENALHWLREYRFDGLRLDAVHAIVEPGEPHILQALSEAVGALAQQSGRLIHLVLENDHNQASLLDPETEKPAGKYRAQWNDDYHHAFHVLLTGEHFGYYEDYREPGPLLARTLAQGFAYQGEPSPHRHDAPRGEPSGYLPTTAFVNFIQNHDQIGNRARGDRLTTLVTAPALDAALTITLLVPMPPLLFMGEEWGAREPFPFFCDFRGGLAKAVREGRKREFAEAYAETPQEIPDPLAECTVRAATLDWVAVKEPEHHQRLELVTRLLAVRRLQIAPLLPALQVGSGRAAFKDGMLVASWRFSSARKLSLIANMTAQPQPYPEHDPGTMIWGDEPTATLAPWSVHAALGVAS